MFHRIQSQSKLNLEIKLVIYDFHSKDYIQEKIFVMDQLHILVYLNVI